MLLYFPLKVIQHHRPRGLLRGIVASEAMRSNISIAVLLSWARVTASPLLLEVITLTGISDCNMDLS